MSFPRYPAYKDSGVEWLGEVPEHWEARPIKTVAHIDNSGFYGEDEDVHPLRMPVATTAQIDRDGRFSVEDMPVRSFTEGERNRYGCRPGDVLVVKSSGSAANIISGKAGLVSETDPHFVFSNFLMRLQVNQEVSTAAFLFYFIKSNITRQRVQLMCSSTTYPNLKVGEYTSAYILLPSIDEQGQITSFLDHEVAKTDALIAEQQRLIELLWEKRQAVISHAVTKGLNPDAPMKDSGVEWLGEVPEHWSVTQLRHFSRSLPGYAFPSTGFVEDESQWKLLRGINVGVSCIRWDETVYWKREDGDQLNEYVLAPGDLVVGLDRPLIKDGLRVARLQPADCPCLLLQRVAAVKGTIDLATDYLYHLLSSPFFVAHFEPDTTGVSVPHISTSQIDSFVVPMPSHEEQMEIVKYLSEQFRKIEELRTESIKSISLLKERRSALISAAVTGQIDVRGLVSAEATA